MGLFSEETELEKNYKKLIKIIKSANNSYSYDALGFLIDYVTDVKDGKCPNDFYEFEFLNDVIITLLNDDYDIRRDFDRVKEAVKFLLPEGMNTPDYQAIKSLILNGIGEIDIRLYALFDNRLDYNYVIKMIRKDAEDYEDDVVRYALEVAPYCINQAILKNEVLAFVNGLRDEVDDIDEYFKRKLEEAKKRCGVYPIDEKTLALISAEAKKAQSLIRRLDNMQKRVEDYQESIRTLTNEGKKEIDTHATTKVAEMQEEIRMVQQQIVSKLDEYLLTLEASLKKSSDQVFNRILKDSQENLRNIKLAAQSLSTTTTQDLMRLQQASEESIERLKKYVEGEPQLQQYLKEAATSDAVREALVRMNETKEEQARRVALGASAGIIIPGHDRLVVPANPNVILPHEQTARAILPAFDESIPFDIRYARILEEKKRRENNGEIFHEMVDEVINCVMEGDWVYLWGPSGCGKSHIIKQVASLIGIELVENGKITDKYSIMAYNDPHGRFRATQTFVALLYGKMISYDEFDNGNSDTHVVLNELYSGLLDTLENPERQRFVTFAEDMTVPIHPNYRMISAGNTCGEGENQIFSSRGKIDESVLERMTPKRFDYDNRVEQRIFGEYENWYNLFINFRKCCDDYATRNGLSVAPGMITTRDAAAIKKYIRHNSKSVEQVIREKFVQTKDESYRMSIAKTISSIYGFRDKDDVEIPEGMALGEIEEAVLARKLVHSCSTGRK